MKLEYRKIIHLNLREVNVFPQGKSTFVCNSLVAYKFDTNTFTSDGLF